MKVERLKYLRGYLFSKVAIIVILTPLYLAAQSIEFSASCDKTTVALGETVTLTVTVSGDVAKVPNPILPELKDFDIYSSGRNQSFSFINGKVSSSINYTYKIVPRRVGKFTIPPVKLQYKGTTLQTDSMFIEVVKEQEPSPQKLVPQRPEESVPASQAKKDLFATATLSKTKAYVGEQVLFTLKFYQGVQLLAAPQYSPPDFSGFWAENLSEDTGYRTVEGRQYYVYEIKYALFPVSPGDYTIPSIPFTCQIDDFFSRPFSLGGRKEVVQTDPVTLTVIPLPQEGVPKSFTGGVGKFSITSSVDKNIVNQNEPVVLYFKVSGSGNFKGIEMPSFEIAGDVKVYEPNSSIKAEQSSSEFKGSKTFEIMLVPATVGEFTIPAIEFSYFEPEAKKYITKRVESIKIKVNPAKSSVTPQGEGLVVREEVQSKGTDIRFIKTNILPRSEKPLLFKNKLFLFVHLLPVIFFLVLLQVKSGRERLLKDVGYARARSAPSKLKRGLMNCMQLLDKPEEFYPRLSRTIVNYVGDKLNIPSPGLTKEKIAESLREKNVEESKISELINLLKRSEQSQFGQSSFGREDTIKDLEKAKEIFRYLSKMKFL